MERLKVDKLKIIFIGIPDMALVCLSNLLEKQFNIVGVVPPLKTHETYELFKNFVKSKNLNLIEFNESPNEIECIQKIKELNPDIGVVCSYNHKLSNDFIKSARMGYINCHPSLLPDYRGAMPYFHIVNNGEKYSGVTLHFMDENFDTGDIIYQEKFELMTTETMGTLFNRTTYMLSDALIKILSDIQKGVEIKRINQKDKKGILAPKMNGYFKINFKNDIDKIDCLIRAANPFFNAYCYFRNVNVKVIKAHKIELKHNFEFGKIVEANEKRLNVAASKGLISFDVFQVGTWGVFQPYDFYRTFTPQTSEFLE